MKIERVKWISGFIIGTIMTTTISGIGYRLAIYKEPVVEAATPIVELSHEQEVWLGALEWCESSGRVTAVNPKDRDNTPSYGSFQFKPETFKMFSKIYEIDAKGLLEKEALMNHELQKEIVKNMILDKSTKWHQQFPDCVKRLGTPPKN